MTPISKNVDIFKVDHSVSDNNVLMTDLNKVRSNIFYFTEI